MWPSNSLGLPVPNFRPRTMQACRPPTVPRKAPPYTIADAEAKQLSFNSRVFSHAGREPCRLVSQ
jgi:hypothetical protein